MEKLKTYLLPGTVILLCGVYAWLNRFILDDAFITFRYARHLAEGLGPVWNPGEAVEGYSNFLWMVLMAGVHKMGMDPVIASQALGVLCFGVNLWLIYQLGLHWLGNQRMALVAMVLSGMCFTMSAFATGGLETSLFGLEWSLAIWTYTRIREAHRPAWPGFLLLGILLGLTQLTRPDGFLLIVPICGMLGWHWWQKKHYSLSRFGVLIVPMLLIIGGHLIWRLSFYGEWLPNTFYIKGEINPLKGLWYVGLFFVVYGFPFLLGWVLPRVRRFKWDGNDWERLFLVGPWLVYLVMIGGDFMEFRMWVPVVPLIYIGVAVHLGRMWKSGWLRWSWPVVLVMAGVLQPFIFRETLPGGNQLTVFSLHREVAEADRGLIDIGKQLGELFDHDPTLHIATGTAGAIPYYSQLQTLDLLGLNNKEIARKGQDADGIAGHRKYGSLDFILKSEVNLQLSRWTIHQSLLELEQNEGFFGATHEEIYTHFGIDPETYPDHPMEVLLVPLSEDEYLVTLYHKPHLKIDSLSRGGHLLSLFPFSKVTPLE